MQLGWSLQAPVPLCLVRGVSMVPTLLRSVPLRQQSAFQSMRRRRMPAPLCRTWVFVSTRRPLDRA